MTFLVHQLLTASAARAPQSSALVAPNGSLTYRELDEQSNRLANLLHTKGVRKGDRVGIDLEKSVEAIVAIYGILKCGAAYVPLDPKAPAKRKAVVVQDCAMRGLVTTPEKLKQLESLVAAKPACMVLTDKAGWSEVLAASASAPSDPGAIETDLAYILYTSGSTGTPKGVMLSHRAALAFVDWATEYFALRADDRLSNHAPLHFDLSVLDLFAAASAGASVALVPPMVAVFPRSLAKWIEAQGITVWYSVPSALTQLVLHAGLEKGALKSLRQILFAGEVFPVQHLRKLTALVPHATYFNLYGPTETNVCTVYRVPPTLEGDVPLPIGRACANTEVFAVDGELLVRGPTLMQGYWGQAEKSAQVLVPHPHFPDRIERAYRTGDLVRQDSAGDFHFIGRRDNQVKSRGYRIELGDVEAALYRHPAVAEAVVVPLPHTEFGAVLRAVIVLRGGASLERAAIAAFCADALPPYMIPEHFEFRAELPKTSNGKVDRRALAEEMAHA